MMELKPGDQVAYIPDHAHGDLLHKDVEFGFVTSVREESEIAFVRYWSKYCKGLRTKANSESTRFENLVKINTRSQSEVDEEFEKILKESEF